MSWTEVNKQTRNKLPISVLFRACCLKLWFSPRPEHRRPAASRPLSIKILLGNPVPSLLSHSPFHDAAFPCNASGADMRLEFSKGLQPKVIIIIDKITDPKLPALLSPQTTHEARVNTMIKTAAPVSLAAYIDMQSCHFYR